MLVHEQKSAANSTSNACAGGVNKFDSLYSLDSGQACALGTTTSCDMTTWGGC
jgi:hypothetical protein